MNEIMNEMMRWLRDVSVCPKCGKSRLYVAVGGRLHGTGQLGVRTGTAIYEPFDPEKHCQCEAGVQAEAPMSSRPVQARPKEKECTSRK